MYTGPILMFTAPGHLPESCLKGHVSFLYLSPFLLQDSWKFPSNFLLQYRAEFPIEFTLSVGHLVLACSEITHMTNYLDFLRYFQYLVKV